MKNKLLLVIILVAAFCVSILSYLIITQENNKKRLAIEEEEKQQKILEIKNHFSENAITTKESKLYKKNNDSYDEYGSINKDVKIGLKVDAIDENTKYFYISDLDSYIDYDSVIASEKHVKSDRYKNYIPFNKNIKTKEKTSFYSEDDKLLYTINQSFDFPIIINNDDKYGVVYNNELLYIKSSDVDKIYNSNNTNLKNKNRIKTLTYHFIYNSKLKECGQAICQSLDMLESHLKYIRENNYFTLKMWELELYLDGKLQIPERSIVLTIDDGTIFDKDALKLLEKYKANATLFLITGRQKKPSFFLSNYLDIESHTDNMHNVNECAGYGTQGGGILCLPEEQVLKDLKTSQEKIGGSKYFAYPFFDFNDRAIELLKKAGFKLAFIGQYDTDGYSYPLKTDKYKVRRKTIFSDTTMSEFISYLQ